MPPPGATRPPASVSATRQRSPHLAVVPPVEARPVEQPAPTLAPRSAGTPASAVAGWLPLAGGIAVAAVIAVVVAIVAIQLGTDRPASRAGTGRGAAATRAQGAAGNAGEQGLAGATPAGWQKYLDIQYGYEIAVPATWEPVQDRVGRAAFRDPQTGAFARIERTERPLKPLELEPRRAERSYADRGYERIRLDSTKFKGVEAADWEFLFDSSGARWHAADLHLLVEGVGYTISFQVPEDSWPALRATMASIRASFGTEDLAG